ncbi:hypothetical protein M6D93_15145 [Jatrophihabitans telluris]|uniref:Uncharacterized protein n=1 Tax=Jatrophihabitans telluris TaxID=2038343 RepID=A0ABY4QWX2_9ACTN|nr:hypothetical protein [Jatrophihabitans telluris]UQX87627.1 hypothetical protein M6D93_15145 [Jatrophihabitans telluris]
MFSMNSSSMYRRAGGVMTATAVALGALSFSAMPAHATTQATAQPTCASLTQDISDLVAELAWATGYERVLVMRALTADRQKKAQLHCP